MIVLRKTPLARPGALAVTHPHYYMHYLLRKETKETKLIFTTRLPQRLLVTPPLN